MCMQSSKEWRVTKKMNEFLNYKTRKETRIIRINVNAGCRAFWALLLRAFGLPGMDVVVVASIPCSLVHMCLTRKMVYR